MTGIIIFVLIATAFGEIALNVHLTRWLGPLVTYALFAIPTAIGLVLQLRRWPAIITMWWEISVLYPTRRRKLLPRGVMERYSYISFYYLSIVLLLIPGFLTDVVAFYFVLRLPRWPRPLREKQIQKLQEKREAEERERAKPKTWKTYAAQTTLYASPFAEFGLTVWLTGRIGATQTFYLYTASALVGLVIYGAGWPPLQAASKRAPKRNEDGSNTIERQSADYREFLFWSGVALLFVPGLLTDALALWLLFRRERWVNHSAQEEMKKQALKREAEMKVTPDS